MVAVYPQRQSRAARWSRRCAVFGLVLFIVALLAHQLGRLDSEIFILIIGFVGLLIVLGLITFFIGFQRMWSRGDRVGTNLFVSGFLLALLLTPFGYFAWKGITLPMLHDVATDTENRPLLAPVARRTQWMNVPRTMTIEEAEQQLRFYPEAIGHAYALPAERIRQFVDTLVSDRRWKVQRSFTTTNPGERTLNVVAGSFLLGLPVDVAIRVSDEETTTYVDMRSASRFGRHDFGDNAALISGFFADLDTVVAADAAMPQVTR